jgi:hypothetical protein
MNRIYGKPEAAVVAQVPANPVTDVIRSLSLAEKLELLQSLQRGEPVELPIIQGARRQTTSSSDARQSTRFARFAQYCGDGGFEAGPSR